MQFKICPNCGAHLDPGERCDCQDKKEAAPLPRERPQVITPVISLAGLAPEVKRFGMARRG